MYKVRAGSVCGRYAMAGGKRLLCIGNAIVNPGDMVWTDGRCIYGHHQNGSSSYVPVTHDAIDGIPLLFDDGCRRYFHNGELHEMASGKVYRGMCNNSVRIEMFADSNILDAELDAEGNLYVAESGFVSYNTIADSYESVPTRVIRNGEVIADIELMQYLEKAVEDARNDAEAGLPDIPEMPNRTGYDSETNIHYSIVQPCTAKVYDGGRYFYAVIVQSEVEHRKWAYDDIGVHPIGEEGGSQWETRENYAKAGRTRLYIITETDAVCVAEYKELDLSIYTGIGSGRKNSLKKFVEDYSIRVPMNDGYYYTFGGELNNLLNPVDGAYTGNVYSPEGKLICTGEFHPVKSNLSIAVAGTDVSLINEWGIGLYQAKNTELKKIAEACYNFRLMRIKDINAWKGE